MSRAVNNGCTADQNDSPPTTILSYSSSARVRTGGVLAPTSRLRRAQSVGKEHLHGLPVELSLRVPEERLQLAVRQLDAPIRTDRDHGVGGGLEQIADDLCASSELAHQGGGERSGAQHQDVLGGEGAS